MIGLAGLLFSSTAHAQLYTMDQVFNQWRVAGYPVNSAGTYTSNQVSASNVAAVMVPATATALEKTLYNTNTGVNATVYLGPSGVNSSTGFPLTPGTTLKVTGKAAVYGITAGAGASTVSYLQSSQ